MTRQSRVVPVQNTGLQVTVSNWITALNFITFSLLPYRQKSHSYTSTPGGSRNPERIKWHGCKLEGFLDLNIT